MTSTWNATNPAHRAGTDRAEPRTSRGRAVVASLVGAAAAVVLAAGPAAAAPPVVEEEGAFSTTSTVPAEDFPCGVEATFHEDMTFRFTAFLDRAGEVVRRTGHIGGTTTVTTAYGEITNRWRENAKLDPEAGTIAWSGNSFNIHGGPGGVLVNKSGRWVVDAETDAPLFVAGPDEDPEADPTALCAVLAP